MPSDTADRIRHYIATEIAYDVDEADLTDGLDLVALGVVTSLSLLRVVAWIGDEFALPVNELDIDPAAIRTVQGLAAFVDHERTITAQH